MSASRFGRMQKAAVLVPLALLSGAWTISVAGTGAQATPEENTQQAASNVTVPTEAIDKPASVSSPDQAAANFNGSEADIDAIVSTSSTNGIPAAALTAYQRAETVINAADESCHITWQLVAAIGRVESNHGRFGGSALNAEGVATPGIYGIALDGKNNTSVIRDTDGGVLDNDTVYDRAVGPMQFIPSTWSAVQVDGDDDGQRNPQDIDDAALATAVYLCSGPGDLSTLSGQREAVYRYNHSDSYVNLVLSIMENYLGGDYTSVPNDTTAAGYIPTLPSNNNNPGPGPNRNNGPSNNNNNPGTTSTEPTPEAPAETTPPKENTPTNEPTPNPPPKPSQAPEVPDTGVGPVDDTVDQVEEVVGGTLTAAQAIVYCTSLGYVNNPLDRNDKFDQCVAEYTKP